jgi:hypothetical protein
LGFYSTQPNELKLGNKLGVTLMMCCHLKT